MRRLVVGSAILALVATTFSWALADDHEIARKVAERLKQEQKEGNLQGFNINLKVAEGKVTLEGTVSSVEQKEMVEGLAGQVDGVTGIANGLQISSAGIESDSRNSGPQTTTAGNTSHEPSLSEEPVAEPVVDQKAEDRRIGELLTRQLQDAKRDGQLKGFGISIHVENGHVWLKGRVGSDAQQQMVLDLARRTEGVRQVINELNVNESASSIAKNLNDLLQAAESEGTLRGANLNVKIDGPDVWLTGTVSRPEQEQQAVDLARTVPGVRRVISGVELADVRQASVPVPAPVASLLPPAIIPVTRLDRPQSEPAAAVQPAPMVAPQQPPVQELAVAPVAPVAEQPNDVRFTKPVSAESLVPAQTVHAAAPEPRPMEAPVMETPVMLVEAAPMPPPVAYVQYQQYPTTQVVMDQTPRPLGLPQLATYAGAAAAAPVMAISHATGMMPAHLPGPGHAVVPARYDHPSLPGYAWPSYAAYPNYAAVTYPKQYSPSAWPYIGPFYPYPQVPLGWRKVTLKWDNGWWNLDFKAK